MDFKGKNAIITGASSGIGMEIARLLAQKGCDLDCMDLNEKDGLQLTEDLKKIGCDAQFYKVDVSNEKEVTDAVNSVIKHRGKVDILIHNAGITARRDFFDLTSEEWDKTIKVNLYSTFYTAKAVSKAMVERKYGRIVIVSSGSAITGTGGGAHYAASKAGQIGFTRALANKLSPYGITVNCVGPRNIETPMLSNLYSESEKNQLIQKIPLKRLGSARDVANLILFLVSDESDYMTGQFILIDGGRTFSS